MSLRTSGAPHSESKITMTASGSHTSMQRTLVWPLPGIPSGHNPFPCLPLRGWCSAQRIQINQLPVAIALQCIGAQRADEVAVKFLGSPVPHLSLRASAHTGVALSKDSLRSQSPGSSENFDRTRRGRCPHRPETKTYTYIPALHKHFSTVPSGGNVLVPARTLIRSRLRGRCRKAAPLSTPRPP